MCEHTTDFCLLLLQRSDLGGNFGFSVRVNHLRKNRGEIRSIASVYVELASADRKGGAFSPRRRKEEEEEKKNAQ
jgi:hypothetical protein